MSSLIIISTDDKDFPSDFNTIQFGNELTELNKSLTFSFGGKTPTDLFIEIFGEEDIVSESDLRTLVYNHAPKMSEEEQLEQEGMSEDANALLNTQEFKEILSAMQKQSELASGQEEAINFLKDELQKVLSLVNDLEEKVGSVESSS